MKNRFHAAAALIVICLTIAGTGCRKKAPPAQEPQAAATVPEVAAEAKPIFAPAAEGEVLAGVAAYPGSVKDEDKCGPASFYVEGVAAEKVTREYCEQLQQAGWRLMGSSDGGGECRSFANGSMTFRNRRMMIIDFWKYGETKTCYHAKFLR